jgi:glutamine---fructose-6-phosphate transaminase (isomerizing)
MNHLIPEIDEIPLRATDFLRSAPDYKLPLGVPYLGMGSSYFAPLAFRYMGINIIPEIASEYFELRKHSPKSSRGVILSQSGESSESLWCSDLFNSFVCITNSTDSSLGRHTGAEKTILIHGGEEKYSSSKTYINTLLALFRGFGINPEVAVDLLHKKAEKYREKGKQMAEEVYRLRSTGKIHGMYILGSGPNIATAYEASLILSETTKLCYTGLPMAQYDHGPKETAADSIVIQIMSKGSSYDRTKKLSEKISSAGAHVLVVEEEDLPEELTILNNIVPFNYMAAYLAEKLNIGKTFAIGGKVTTVPSGK